MKTSLRNRIALYYLLATASVAIVLFALIYGVVYQTVYNHLNDDLDSETHEVLNSIVVLDNQFVFANPAEWDEREHGKIEVNPTFIQIVDTLGKSIRKTPNLVDTDLKFNPAWREPTIRNTNLGGSAVRQIQTPITSPSGATLGFLIVAIPLAESALVLSNLKMVLILAIPISLLVLFFISRALAGRSIKPLNDVITTAEVISQDGLSHRIPVPSHRDELHRLATTLNTLMDRLEKTFEREKQFTANASHELRTPLAVIRGTLDVLVRKPREVSQYEEKIQYCIRETDRMTNLIEQLLLLARYDSGDMQPEPELVSLAPMVESILARYSEIISEKRLSVGHQIDANANALVDSRMLEMMLENVISNAIKYSGYDAQVTITVQTLSAGTQICIEDTGQGMTTDQLGHIFNRFYRADESRDADTPGIGLGLAIVKKLADLQGIQINVESQVGVGTRFSLTIPSTSI